MKNIYFSLLLFGLAGVCQAQKMNFKATAAATYPTINTTTTGGQLITGIPSSTGITLSRQQVELKESFETKPGIRLGGSINLSLSAKFSFETGLQVQLTRFKRMTKINMVTTLPQSETTGTPIGSSYGYYQTDGNGNVIFKEQPNSSTNNQPRQPSDKVGNTHLVYVDIPVNLSYTAFNKRLTFKGGVVGSILAYAEQYKSNGFLSTNGNTDALVNPWNPRGGTAPMASPAVRRYQEYTDKSRKDFNSLLLALNAGVTFRLHARWGLTAEYAHSLNNVYNSDSGVAKKSKYKTGSLGVSYQF